MIGEKNDPKKLAKNLIEKNRQALQDLGFEPSIDLDILTYAILASLAELLVLILSTGNTRLYAQILSEYEHLLKEKAPKKLIKVETAVSLTEVEEEELKEGLKKIVTGEFKLDVKVNPKIAGGLIIKIGDKVIDQSLVRKLEGLRESLIREKGPESRV